MPEFELRRPWAAFRRNHCLSMLLTLVVSASASGARAQATQESPSQTAMGTIRGVVTALQQAEENRLEGIQVELQGAVGSRNLLLRPLRIPKGVTSSRSCCKTGIPSV